MHHVALCPDTAVAASLAQWICGPVVLAGRTPRLRTVKLFLFRCFLAVKLFKWFTLNNRIRGLVRLAVPAKPGR